MVERLTLLREVDTAEREILKEKEREVTLYWCQENGSQSPRNEEEEDQLEGNAGPGLFFFRPTAELNNCVLVSPVD